MLENRRRIQNFIKIRYTETGDWLSIEGPCGETWSKRTQFINSRRTTRSESQLTLSLTNEANLIRKTNSRGLKITSLAVVKEF